MTNEIKRYPKQTPTERKFVKRETHLEQVQKQVTQISAKSAEKSWNDFSQFIEAQKSTQLELFVA